LAARICPLCDKQMDEDVCPEDGVPTIESSVFDAPEEAILPGMSIAGRYKVIRLAGRGAMGSVFEATQLSMDRRVAVKTLQKNLISDQMHVKRFYLEARAASQLDHPNIVRIFDFGIDDATKVPFIVMEFLDGGDLSDSIESIGAHNERDSCLLMAQVAKALVAAHGKGIVHRDLKPDNINLRTLADGDQQAKVLDFGIAKVLHGGSDSLKNLTGTGMTMGTPLYMSPEQIRGEKVDFRTDLYALGCILHEMLTGQRPYSSDERMGIFMQHISGDLPVLPEVLVDQKPPSDTLRILHRALLSKKREERPSTTSSVAKLLTACSLGEDVDAVAILGLGPETLDSLATDPDQKATKLPAKALSGTENTMAAPSLGTKPSTSVPAEDGMETLATEATADSGVSSSSAKKLGVAALGLAVATLAMLFWIPSEEAGPKEKRSAESATSEQSKAPAPVETKPTSPESVELSPKIAPPASVAAAKPQFPAVVIRLETVPPGATIREGATSLGNSPVELMIAQGVPSRTLEIEMRGHKTKTVLVDRENKNPLKVVLEANPVAAPAAATRSVKRTRRSSESQAKPKPKPKPKPKKAEIQVW
jgi:serine/threonine protein kinase